MANKVLNTRIQLKYDTLANWVAHKSIVPLAGELCICYVPAITTGTTQVAPTVLFKVGDGTKTWENLPWASGRAADVYDWAKTATKPDYSASEITGLSDVATSGNVDDLTQSSSSYFILDCGSSTVNV